MGASHRQTVRKHLDWDALLATIRERFATIPDSRSKDHTISLPDALMSGFALFALKEPSLLAFQERIKDDNLRTIYGIEHVPSDTQMRVILDPVDPECLRPCYTDVFRELQRGKALEPFVFYQGCYLLSLDGSQYFSSEKIHCASCLERHHKNGKVTYAHQMLQGVIVHPDLAEVIPVAPEPIIKQDGATKNDCERNACKRFLPKFRADHPHLPVIVVADGLSSTGPQIKDFQEHRMHFILGAKPGDHGPLFALMAAAAEAGTARVLTLSDSETGTIHHFRWLCQVPLNDSHPDLLVNFLEYWEVSANGKVQYFSWVTDLDLNEESVWFVMRGGRARWKIENETFNTLKNQGYHFEHNFGHGEENLSVVFAMLMMLAFLVDQVQQLCSTLFRSVWQKFGTKRLMWDRMRALFCSFAFDSMQELFEALLGRLHKRKPLMDDSA
jgi:ribosome biogenesis protein Tsr3